MHMSNSSDLSARKPLNASRTANCFGRVFLLRFGHIATVALSRRVAACPKLLRKIKRCAEAARGMHNPLDGCSSGFLAVPRRQHRRRALSHAALDPPRCFCAAGFRRSLDRPLLWRRRLPQRTVPTSDCYAELALFHEETCARRDVRCSCNPWAHRRRCQRSHGSQSAQSAPLGLVPAWVWGEVRSVPPPSSSDGGGTGRSSSGRRRRQHGWRRVSSSDGAPRPP